MYNPGVTINPSGHQVHIYSVTTPIYEGPLDLLLQLIEKAELDITRVALAAVTDQYLTHLKQLQELVPGEVSAFVVIASKLIQIKSEALLPRPPFREVGEDDPAEALARQLILYKRFRQIADFLAAREEAGIRSYLRMVPVPKVEGNLDLTGISLEDLLSAAITIFASNSRKQSLSTVVSPPRITIREKISLISSFLKRFHRTTFSRLFDERKSRLDIVVTFLAMLELIKRKMVRAQQDHLFGDISIEPTETWDGAEEFELEFGE